MEADPFEAISRTLVGRLDRRALVGGAIVVGTFTLAVPSPVAATPQQTAICSPAIAGSTSSIGNPRYAATFLAGVSGKLSQVEIHLDNTAGSVGAFVVKLQAVDPSTGEPTSKVLATRKVLADSVPGGLNVTLVARFKKRHTTKLVQGLQYAVVISRPTGDTNDWALPDATGNLCPDSRFFVSQEQSGPFQESASTDVLFTVFVGV